MFISGENICTFKILTQKNDWDPNDAHDYYIENISKGLVLGFTDKYNGAVTEQVLDLQNDARQTWILEMDSFHGYQDGKLV